MKFNIEVLEQRKKLNKYYFRENWRSKSYLPRGASGF